MAETWRIDTGRDVREVEIAPRGAYWATASAGDRATLWPTPREAVQEHAYRNSVMGTVLAPGEPTRGELGAQLAVVTRERDVLREQIGPLLDAHDALVAAARAAGWTGAGATGAELVAWVRRGEREACAVRCDAVAKGADNALPGREGDQRAYLKGRRRGAEVCAEALREGGE